jgi:peptidoglycan/LPS O-acetylase OafA/YrhL
VEININAGISKVGLWRSVSNRLNVAEVTAAPSPQAGHIGALDGWRGVAVLLVIIDHCGELSHSGLIHKVTRVGATGVGLFFALSGFLITTLLLKEFAQTDTISLTNFYIRRIFRILPPVFVYLAVLVLFRHLNLLPFPTRQLVSCVLLFRNYLPGDWRVGWYTLHLWSLMVEEHFYILWPFLLLVSKGRLKVPVLFAVLVAAWRTLNGHIHTLRDVWAPGRTDLRIDSLLWGCALAIILFNPIWRERLKLKLSGVIICLLLAIDVISNVIHGVHDYSWFEPIILALLLVWPLLHPGTLLRKFLDSRTISSIGKVSYSLYIWQQFWLLFPGAPFVFPKLQSFPLNVIMAAACALISYYLIEQPFISAGRSVIRHFKTRQLSPQIVSE